MDISELRPNNVIKIFNDWKNCTDFAGWVKLVKHAPIEEYLLPAKGNRKISGKIPYIKREGHFSNKVFPEKGEKLWHEGKVHHAIDINKQTGELCICRDLTADDYLFVEIEDISLYYSPNFYDIYSDESYEGRWWVYKDQGRSLLARKMGQKRSFSKRKYRISRTDAKIRAEHWSGQRWKVKPFGPPFMSDLREGKPLYFKDWGRVQVVDILEDKLIIRFEGQEFVVKKDLTNFFVEKDVGYQHRTIGFYLITSSSIKSMSKEWDSISEEE